MGFLVLLLFNLGDGFCSGIPSVCIILEGFGGQPVGFWAEMAVISNV